MQTIEKDLGLCEKQEEEVPADLSLQHENTKKRERGKGQKCVTGPLLGPSIFLFFLSGFLASCLPSFLLSCIHQAFLRLPIHPFLREFWKLKNCVFLPCFLPAAAAAAARSFGCWAIGGGLYSGTHLRRMRSISARQNGLLKRRRTRTKYKGRKTKGLLTKERGRLAKEATSAKPINQRQT